MSLEDSLYFNGYRDTVIKVVYFMPDYDNLLQEFMWQYMDLKPEFPKTHQFLDHWQENIEAVINNIYLAHNEHVSTQSFRNVSHLFQINTLH